MANGDVGERKVYKDDAVEEMDKFLSGSGSMTLEEALDYARGILVDDTLSLAELTARQVVPAALELSSEQVDHFQDLRHWPAYTQDEMRTGYLDAVRLATEDEPLPIETFWVTGPNEKFEIFAKKGPRQVTVLVFIPPEVEAHARDQWEPSRPAS